MFDIRIKAKDFFYYIFISSLIFMYMFESTSIKHFNSSILQNVVLIISLCSAAIHTFVQKYSLKTLLRLIILNLVGVLCFFSSGNTGLFLTILAVSLMPKDSLENILVFIFKEELILFVLIIISSQIGLLSAQQIEINKGTYTTIGSALGFVHPNMLAAQATSIILLYICINRRRLQFQQIIWSLVGCMIIYAISKSRTAFVLGIFSLLLLAVRKKRIVEILIYKILPYTYVLILFFIAALIGLFAQFGNTNNIVQTINNSVFNGRISLAYTSLVVYPVTPLGKNIDTSIWNEWQYYALDNGQVMVLLQYGIIGFVIYFWIIQKALNQIKKEKETVFAIIIMSFLLWSMYEGTMYFLGKNFALLFLGLANWNNSTKINIRNKRDDP